MVSAAFVLDRVMQKNFQEWEVLKPLMWEVLQEMTEASFIGNKKE